MLKVATLGIGNAGNQTADLAKRAYKIEGIALNSSENDITNVHDIHSIVVGDDKGAGKDRNIAKDFIFNQARELLVNSEFKDLIDDHEVIFIPTSTDGGTGSGMAPVLTDLLRRKYPSKRFILIGILPTLKESLAGQQNTIEYLKEIRNFNPTYMLYDNNNRANLPRNEMMLAVNREIVTDMAIIRGDFQFNTPYTSIDEKDGLKIIETPGRLVIAREFGFKEKDIDDRSIEDRLIESIRTSAHAELDHDQIIKRLGLITNLSDKLHKTFDSNLPKFKNQYGEPVEGFEHIYINKSDTEENRIIALMSGLSVPDDRLEKIVQRITELTTELSRTKESSVLDHVNTDLVDQLRNTGNKTTNKEQSNDDLDALFGQYIK